MSIVIGEKLIEFAIRIGFDDLKKDKDLVLALLPNDKSLNEGMEMEDEATGAPVFEKTVMEEFAQRLSEIPKKPSETGKDDIFERGIPDAEKLWEYIQTCNMGIRTGFPRDQQELPCLCINIGAEDEEEFLAHAGFAGGDGSKDLAAINDTSYTVTILTTNYEETLIWYVICKYALMRYRAALEGHGLQSAKVRWEDLEPGPEYLQSGTFVYQRAALFSCMKMDTIPTTPLSDITGIQLRKVDQA